ncbi:TrkA C-terminal domain-containing protein [Halorubrum luteum]
MFTAAGLAGRTIAEADVRDRTGAMIVAVERDGDPTVRLLRSGVSASGQSLSDWHQ